MKNQPLHIIKTETPYTADHHGRVRVVTRATWSDGSQSMVAVKDIVTINGKKTERKTKR